MTDIEIARSVEGLNIKEIGKKIGLTDNNLVYYGSDKAKIKYNPTFNSPKVNLPSLSVLASLI